MVTTLTATVLAASVSRSGREEAGVASSAETSLAASMLDELGALATGIGGRQFDRSAEGFLVAFTSAAAAVACAIDLQRHGSSACALRIGVSAGDVEVNDDAWFGRPVVEARRLSAAAAPAQVLVSDLVRALAGGYGRHQMAPAGEIELRGFEQPVVVHEVVWQERAAAPASTVTVLLTDIEGSTRLWEERRVEMGRALARHDAILREAVVSHGGTVWKGAGDGVYAIFTVPGPALAAAASAARSLAVEDRTTGVVLRVRMAVATGVAEPRAGEWFGPAVNRAARFLDATQPGQILVGEATATIARSELPAATRLRDLGRHQFRGLNEPELLHDLLLDGLPEPDAAITDDPDADAGPSDTVPEPLAIPLPGLLTLDAPVAFVARSDEWDTLEGAWLAAHEGRRHIVLIGGEPGAGKTRLVTEFARTTHRRGAVVLYGSSSPTVEVPFQPFAQALDHLMTSLSIAERDRLVGPTRPDLARLLPRLATDADRPTSPDDDPDATRYRLHEAVTDLLATVSDEAPVLLVLDDLHWAHRPTIQLLEHLVRSNRLTRLCVLATFRNAPADVGDALREALPELRRRPGVERISLAGFDRSGIRSYVAALADQELTPDLEPLVAHLEASTDGNPFLVGELWRHLVDDGRLRTERGSWMVAGPLDDAISPETVREVVASRVARLPADTQTLLQLAAVAGDAFVLEVVAAAGGLDEATAFDDLEPAVAARLVQDAGTTRFRFAHALVRRSVEDTLPTGLRRRHHLAIGRALEASGTGDLADLAHHFTVAIPLAPAEVAVGYARQAASEAMASAAYDDASSAIGRVLPAVTDKATRAQLLLEQAEAYGRAGTTTLAIQVCARSAELARELGDQVLLARAAVAMTDATWRGAAFGGPAAILVEEALATPTDDATRARLLAALSTALAFSGRDDEAIETASEAVAAARATGDRVLLLDALLCPTFVAWRPSTIQMQLDAATEGVALAEELRDDDKLVSRLDKLLAGLILIGDVDGHAAALARHGELARRRRQPLFQLVDLQVQGTLAMNQGRFPEAERLAEEANRWSDDLPHASGGYGVQMFVIRREQGRLHEVRPVVEAVASLGREGATWRPGLAAIYAELGLLDACSSLLDELVADDLALVPRDSLWIGALTFLADAAAAVGSPDAATAIGSHLREFSGLMASVPGLACFGAVDRYLGRIAEVRDRPAEAIAYYEAALTTDQRSGWSVWTAHSQLALGRVLARQAGRSSRERGTALMRASLDTAQALGMEAVADRCRAALDDAAAFSDGAAPVPLTSREISVLRLVAQGRTNRQIGDALHLSQHTVAAHMRSILLKTGCASRAEAAVYASRKRLLTDD